MESESQRLQIAAHHRPLSTVQLVLIRSVPKGSIRRAIRRVVATARLHTLFPFGRAVGKPFAAFMAAAPTGKFPRGLSGVMVGVQRREREHCSRWTSRRAPLEPSVSACHSDKRLSIRT